MDDLDLGLLPAVTMHRGAVPGELDPGRFIATICNVVLDRTPVISTASPGHARSVRACARARVR